jgi:glycogen debranching enzyme
MQELMSNYYGGLLSIFRYNSTTGEGVWALVRLTEELHSAEITSPAPIDLLCFEARILECHQFPDDPEAPIRPSEVRLFVNTDHGSLKSVRVHGTTVELVNFPVGSVSVFKVSLPQQLRTFLRQLEMKDLVAEFRHRLRVIGLIDLGVLMFRSDEEERIAQGNGAYSFPNFGTPFYAGTQGIETAFAFAAKSPENMASPVFYNIRDGNWLIGNIAGRLFQSPRLIGIEGLLRKRLEDTDKLPRFLVPKYLDRIVRALNIAAREMIFKQMSQFVQNGDDLVRSLATTSISFYTPVRNAQLVHPNLTRFFSGLISRADCSTAAGFPHFATGFMRSWGRDTMIALRGLFLVTGRFQEARDPLIAFAACLRHGLIPNLHDGGLNPRYNARDATWWFLQALQDYALMSGDGGNVFNWRLPRLFPTDNQAEHNRRANETRAIVAMADIVQEIMTAHANGIHFTEWNAGAQIDAVMRTEGFNIDIVTDWTNGFVLGGNEFNCGTWMDKMGSREKAKMQESRQHRATALPSKSSGCSSRHSAG